MKTTKIFLIALMAVLAIQGCKDDSSTIPTPGDDDNIIVELSKFDKITDHVWIMRDVYYDGFEVTTSGTTPYLFEKNGMFREDKNFDGSWKNNSSWGFTNSDSTFVHIYKGKVNQQPWEITNLENEVMDVVYVTSAGGTFVFKFVPE
jgi:hypothetical protein